MGRSATPIFSIPTGYPSWLHRYRRPNFRMQQHRLLIDTHHRFPRRERLFIHGQHILHARDIFLIEFDSAPRTGRGRSQDVSVISIHAMFLTWPIFDAKGL
jgi:hypothetical protein